MDGRAPTIAVLTLIAVMDASGIRQARADANAPVCAQTYGKSDGLSCNYTTYEQCRASVAGLAGSCIENPYYKANSKQTVPRRRGRH